MSVEGDALVWGVIDGLERSAAMADAPIHEPTGLQGHVDLLKLAQTRHLLTRKGAEMKVRVMPVPGRDGGQAVIIGDAELRADPPLVRIHSRCLYGDALQSDDCDCGPELDRAMDLMQLEDAGVLLYLEQEGRGAGLEVKARGLGLTQTLGYDTFAAYDKLGYQHDCRNYDTAAEFLKSLGLRNVRLLTNNPDKVEALHRCEIVVTQVLLHTEPRSASARKYLQAKRIRRGHLLPEEPLLSVRRYVVQAGIAACAVGTGVAICWGAKELAALGYLLLTTALLSCRLTRTPTRLRMRAWRRRRAARPDRDLAATQSR